MAPRKSTSYACKKKAPAPATRRVAKTKTSKPIASRKRSSKANAKANRKGPSISKAKNNGKSMKKGTYKCPQCKGAGYLKGKPKKFSSGRGSVFAEFIKNVSETMERNKLKKGNELFSIAGNCWKCLTVEQRKEFAQKVNKSYKGPSARECSDPGPYPPPPSTGSGSGSGPSDGSGYAFLPPTGQQWSIFDYFAGRSSSKNPDNNSTLFTREYNHKSAGSFP